MDTNLNNAVKCFIARQDRRAHPEGKFDDAGRWYPGQYEIQDCCSGVRTPSRAWPMSLMTHCRTAEHIGKLYGVDPKDIRREARIARKLAEVEKQEQNSMEVLFA